MTQEEHERLMESQRKRYEATIRDLSPQTDERVPTAIDELRGAVARMWPNSTTLLLLACVYKFACWELEEIEEANATGQFSDAEEWRREDDQRRLREMKATFCQERLWHWN